MKKIAITGCYAAGKTYILSIIKDMGYPVFSSDEYVRFLYSQAEFRDNLWKSLGEKGSFDKFLIKDKISKDTEFRLKLESLVHPSVIRGMDEFISIHQGNLIKSESKNDLILFLEIPLLFESNLSKNFDGVICVYCDESTRLERASKKAGFSKDFFEAINKIQMSQEMKKSMSDYLINTDKNLTSIKTEIKNIIAQILV